ncbi:DNA-directed DNA polymerase alpha catalytic subunit pol1 [Cadophora gregata]|uniref:DNA-directed DNA polymerase alpha catalytic subunit pol1 n=1 Tax=Cadophora gregata TaxID=51156 RepID=UPI0026DAED25|nr:DNA-directed DNA polymerase alpha catalytic subunit pol1 [Cadophora gregata]KAK0099991.1 DNA-directed DNA polymerase alpha catalytic subunit pol1 [Cadophora gregata f. sp. sojae]KAK0116161.1 DNA-directed DNA polymerase alpha catalytic subunit pol1 [Cadophora gregata]
MSKATNARNRFAELRELRASGKKRLDTYQVQEEEDLYEEVDEDGYKKVVRERLNQDDFVIDDNGEGYADDGREEWDQQPNYGSGSDEDLPVKGKSGKAAKRKREEDKAKKEKIDKGISNYFTKGPVAAQPKAKPIKTKADDDFLADLLGEVDTNVPRPSVQSARSRRVQDKRRTRALSPGVSELPRHTAKKAKVDDTKGPVSPPEDHDYGDDTYMPMDDDMAMDEPLPSSPVAKAVERKSNIAVKVEDDEEEDMMEVAQADGIVTARINISGTRPPPKIKKTEMYPTPASSSPTRAPPQHIDASAWNNVTDRLNVVNSSQVSDTGSFGKLDYADAIEEDGSLRMFWTDYTEVNGSLCLFGKVQNKKHGSYVSCFLKVDNILRKLFFLPRQYRQKHGRGTSDEVDMKDVYEEVDGLMGKLRVGMHKIKPCTRKYAFELPDIPREGEYLKLLYPYSKPQLQPEHQTGTTFSHVFGTNTPLFEQFVLWKNIMGPCWLKIEDAEFGVLNNSSFCMLEVQVSKPNLITALSENDNLEAPPLTLMSIALRTTLNVKENKQEILAISARIYQNISLTDTTPPEKLPCRSFTVMRPALNSFPIGFDTEVQRRAKGMVKLVKQEQEVLSFFLAQLQVTDPDVLMGHQLEGVDFSILLSRLQAKKTPQWARIGRMRRSNWPSSMGKMGGNFFAERTLLSGRLLCDLANDAGKSAMSKCTSWSLTEMCSIYLPGTIRREVDNEQALKTWASTKDGLMDYVTHCEADTFFIAALALKVQLLPLTKVLTNLAGNSWARTLTGTRAERNEYILLHEFHRNKYICPDKAVFKGKQQVEEENADEESGDVKKKDKYKGGLVFEPEKGLYDKFVLVMDFNSLYPSIIQEFNICFTTVDRTNLSDDDDQVPEVPVDQDLGILPKLIATLVSRRRQVKGLMKDKNATSEQLATWDIKQLALKLTANSMYGCLGYTKSRFYARPLAVLTTYKGREILRSTKDLAESNSLQVIYGDTDSVMINANVDNVEDAFKVGNEFKKAVNERYRLLEIDIDNVFRRILLQAKKKYAAINLVQVDGKFVDKMEVKGLDMKRREYCNLSKEVSGKLLDEILSGDDSELVITRIHEYLREISTKMRQGEVPTQKYTIYTKLGKAPKEYPNADSMPQVQVALRELSRGKNVRKDDVIAYIVTGDGKTTSENAAKRSYTPQDVAKTDSGLSPDVEWYLYKQIFPPVERLCANISGTDTVRLADCLGLDVLKYSISNNASNGGGEAEISPLESLIDDEVRFKDAFRLSLRCRACKAKFGFDGLVGSLDICTAAGITCRCGHALSNLSVMAQLEHQIRQQTSRYYEGWLICNDQACGNRTRQMSVYGHRCLGPKGLAQGCLGIMHYEYTEKMMYNQLLYFSSLFDVEKAKTTAKGTERERILALAEHNRIRFGTLKTVVEKYLDKCGRQWVNMDSLFGKLGFTAI